MPVPGCGGNIDSPCPLDLKGNLMYESFYGLREEPFRLTPDSQYVFEHPSYSRAKAYLEYGVGRGEGVVMVTGEPGSGKTTLVEHLLGSLPGGTRVANLVSTQLEATDLLRMVLFGFGLEATTGSKSDALVAIQRFLLNNYEHGHSTVLVVDEAQDLTAEALEELRLLTNVTQGGRPLLQVLLVGQDELLERVRSPGLEQLHQRIVAAYRLHPLNEAQTRAYIEQRLRVAGWIGNPRITEMAMRLIHRVSGGNPRRINMLCGRLLLYGYVDELHSLTVADVRSVVEEMGHAKPGPRHRGIGGVGRNRARGCEGAVAGARGGTARPHRAATRPGFCQFGCRGTRG